MDTIVSVSIELVVLTSSWITSLKDAEQASRTFREVRVPQRFFFFFFTPTFHQQLSQHSQRPVFLS